MVKFYLSQFSAFSFSAGLKRLLTAVLILLFISPVIAQQQKKDYTLLWRISGKGLTKPSYLFGTMHVKDKRVFGFSDSVMLAIQKSETFALEVHPDTLMSKMFATLADKESRRGLRDMLSPEEYAKIAKRFKQKNGYAMGNIDPMQLESVMRPEKKNPDDKKTFIDAFLYGVAHGMNKPIYGLENAAQQFDGYFGANSDIKERIKNLVDDNDKEIINSEEEMIKIYSTGNLNKLAAYLSLSELNDDELIARNKVMLNSIVSHIHNQSLFSAVGAAHLPGPHGLIELLRNTGYTVEPVKADFTGVANRFNTDYTKLNWKPYVDNENGYSFELPFTPEKTNIFLGLPSVIYTDISNEVFFGAYAILKGSDTKPADENAVLQSMVNVFKKNQDNHIVSKKPVAVNGIKGTEILMRTNGDYLRLRVLFSNNFLYLLYAGTQLENLYTPYANRFFNSFKTFKTAPKANPAWITFKNDTGAFAVHLPSEPKLIVKNIPNPIARQGEPFSMKIYLAMDSVNLMTYLVRYNDYPKGSYLADKNKLFDAIGNEFKGKGSMIGKPHKIVVDGYEGREVDFKLLDKYYCRLRLLVRGNRTYLLMKQNIEEEKPLPAGDDFLESFKMISYKKPQATTYNFEGTDFSVTTFEKLRFIRDSVANYRSFLKNSVTAYSTNTASGGVYGVEHTNISKYYRAAHVDSVYNKLIPKFVPYTDTLLKVDTIVVNNITGREFISQSKSTGDKKRERLFIDNGDLFYMTAHIADEELFSETSNEFFNSLKKVRDTQPIDLSSSKAAVIINDLVSADSVLNQGAKGALAYYDFKKDELPYVYKGLQTSYPADSLYGGPGRLLLNVLNKTHDDKTIEVLSALYKRADINDNMKPQILKTIVDVDKKKGYPVYLDLLTGGPAFKARYNYDTFAPLNDSLDFVQANYDRIIPLLKNQKFRSSLLSVFQSMAGEKDGKYDNLIRTHFNDITAFANADLDKYLSKTDSNSTDMYTPVYYYLSLMKKVKGQPITSTFTAKLLKRNDINKHLPTAVATRIENKLPVSDAVLNKLLDSMVQRYDLMEELSKAKQLARVPAKYKTQAAFAKLCVYQNAIANDEDESAEQLKLLGSITDKGKLFYVFSYKLYSEDEDLRELAISGPYTPGSSKLDFTSYHAYEEQAEKGLTWQKQAKRMIVELKKQNEELQTSAKDVE
ncbi:TraB/GumN family protein [Mucilaginibacter celer]|uniref:TraB/GumN family protein n=1 Tax=Mucilaginibacter celer TaxID=2305508 RepID=A0A494VLW1_9SPHI|nr:TraB/GumN family protein [Mucilaginibacter celer]AYL96266.1 TraB/GumN family protein [Mucilaginibacter celer]